MEAFRDWVKRHKRALIFSVTAVGAGYICYRSLKAHHNGKLIEREKREAHALRLHQAEQRIEAQLKLHFQSIQRISDTTTLPSILAHLKSQLFSQLDFSDLTEKLAQEKNSSGVLSGQEKIELWEKLKVLSFTRATCSMWALTILVLFIRVQLNILARHVYLDTARGISSLEQVEQRKTLSKFCQQSYISLSEFFPGKGIEALILDIKQATSDALASKTLKEACGPADLHSIFECISERLEHQQVDWLSYMIPKRSLQEDEYFCKSTACNMVGNGQRDSVCFNEMETLEDLLSETRAILESQEFQEVLALSFRAVLDGVMEEFEAFFEGGETVPLAKLLPPVSGVGVLLLEQPDENKFIPLVTDLQEVQSFCATVYSATQEEQV